MFHESFGYYAQGVTEATATLPSGWRERLVPFRSAGTGGVTARCLEVHDLWVSKAIASRPKDVEFCRALARLGLVDVHVLSKRLAAVSDLDPRVRFAVEAQIAAT